MPSKHKKTRHELVGLQLRVLDLVNDILDKFNRKINTEVEEQSKANKPIHDGLHVAGRLLENLKFATINYLRLIPKNEADLREQFAEYKVFCKAVINEYKGEIESTLGWGEYLTNMLKEIYNAGVILFSTEKNIHKDSFFKLAGGMSAVKEVNTNLDLDLDNLPPAPKAPG